MTEHEIKILELEVEVARLKGELASFQNIRSNELSNKSSDYYHTTIQSIGDAVITTDNQGRVTLMNAVAEQLTGWTLNESIGLPLDTIFNIINEETREKVPNPVNLVLEKGVVVGLANHTILISKNGTETPIADSGAPIRNGNNIIEGVVLVFRDQTEERIQFFFRDFRISLLEFANEHDKNQILSKSLDEAVKITSSNYGLFFYVNNQSPSLQLSATSGIILPNPGNFNNHILNYNDKEAELFAECINLQKPICSVNSKDYNDFLNFGIQISRELVVPIIRHRKVVALFVVGNKHDSYSQKDIDILNFIADVGYEIAFKKQLQEEMFLSSAKLVERVKELNCLYNLSHLSNETNLSYNEYFEKIVNIIPESWQFPELVVVRINVNDEYFYSNNYSSPVAIIEEFFEYKKGLKGSIMVGYTQSTPACDHGPFLKEEKSLLVSVANIISTYLRNLDFANENKKAEARFMKLFFESPSMNSITNIADARYFMVNEAWQNFFGISTEVAIGKTAVELGIVNPKLSDELLKQFKESKQINNFQFDTYDKDGLSHSFAASLRLIELDGNHYVLSTLTDISEQIKKTSELQRSKEELKLIMDSLPIGISVNTVFPKVEFQYANDNFYKFYRIKPGALNHPDAFWEEAYEDEEFRETIRERVLSDLSSGDPSRFRWENVPIERRGLPTTYITAYSTAIPDSDLVVSTVVDVTYEMKSAIELSHSEENLKVTLDSIGDAVIATDINGLITRFNAVASELTGFTIEEAKGLPLNKVFRIFNALTGEKAINPVDRVLEEGIVVGLANHTKLISKDGTEYQIADSAAPIRLPNGQMIGVVMVFRDVTEDYRIRHELQESEEKYRAVFQNTGTASCIVEANGIISLANRKFAELSGYSIVELEGNHLWTEFVVPEDLARMRQQHELRRINREEALTEYEFRFIDRNKTIHHIHLYIDMIPGTTKSVASLLDITREKENQEALLLSEANLKKAQEIGKIGSWAFDFKTNKVHASEVAKKIYGIGLDEEMTITKAQSIPLQSYRAMMDKALKDLIEHDIPYNLEFRIKRLNDGQIVDIHSIAQFDRINNIVHGTIQDITERKQAELALIESENRFRTFVENANDIIYSISPQGDFTYVSPNWIDFIGVPSKRAIRRSLSEIIHPDDLDVCRSFINTVLTTGQKQSGVEYRVRHNDGSWRWHSSNGSAQLDSEGNIMGYFGIARDITQTKEFQWKIQESEKKLKSIIENSSDAVFISDSTAKFIIVNKKAVDMLNFSPEEFYQMTVLDICPEDERESRMELFTKVLSGETLQVEMDLVGKDNIHVPVELTATLTPDGLVFGSCRDISERRNAQKAIIESESRYRALVSEMQMGLALHEMIFDENNNPIDYRFVEVNPAFERLTGLSRDKVVGRTVLEILPATEKYWIETYGNVVKTGVPVSFDNFAIELKSHYRVSAYRQGDTNFVVLVEDITSRKLAENEIIENRRQLATMMDNLPGLAFRCLNDEFYTMEFISKGSIDLSGYLPDELIDNQMISFNELIYPDDVQYVRKKIGEAVKDNTSYQIEYRIIDKYGKIKWVWEKGKKVKSNEAGIAVLEGLIIDITDKKSVEVELREALERNKAYLDANPDIIFVFNNDGVIVDYIPASSDSDSFVLEEIYKNKNLEEVVPPDLAELTHKKINFVLKNNQAAYSNFSLEIQDKIQYFEARFVKSGNNEVLAFVRNVTESVETENALRHSEEKFRNLFQKHAAIKFIIEPRSGQIVEANDAAAQYYGWTVEKLCSMKISEINTLNTMAVKRELIKARKEENIHFNFTHRKADGSEADVEVFSSRIVVDGKEYLHSIIHDVTEKMKAEYQLKLLSRSVEQNPATIVITDSNGKIEYVNPAFTQTTGYTFEEAVGQNPRVLKSGKHGADFYANLWETIRSGNDWKGDMINRTKSGELYHESVIISPIINDSGKITHFVAVKENISDKVKLINDLITAKEKAEESDKLKSAFLANMSHEIRTPMNGILGFTNLLSTPGLSSQEQDQFIEIIQKSGERMLNTVNDLIDISKIETGQMPLYMHEINLFDMVQSQFRFFKSEAEAKNLKLNLEMVGLNPKEMVVCDQVKLDSIMTNLIKNAIKYTDEGSIQVSVSFSKGIFKFCVTDSGIGIPADRVEAIFNRFEQADIADKRAFEGSGLGLAITKAYVDMLHGNIELKSTVGIGSTFKVEIPVKSESEISSENASNQIEIETSASPLKNSYKILIAEDDPVGVLYLMSMLKEIDCEILQAKTGLEAVRLFDENPDVDLILMDIKMPDMDGHKATEIIRQKNQEVTIIAQTAYALAGDREKALASGCNDYLSKPILKEDFLRLIRNYCNRSNV